MENNAKSVATLIALVQPIKTPGKVETEKVIIYDECGDTLWDAVLAQEDKSTELRNPEED